MTRRLNNARNQRLTILRMSDRRSWSVVVRDAIKQARTLQAAAEALEVHRDTLREWCRELGIPRRKPGLRKSTRAA